MLKIEMAPIVIPLLLTSTPTIADVTSELARCELESERLFPAPLTGAPRIGRNGPQITEAGREYRNVHAGGWLQRHCRMFCAPQDL